MLILFLYIYFIFNLNIFFIHVLTPTYILIYLYFMSRQLGPYSKYFLAPSLALTKRVLNFSFMPPPHNGVSLCEMTYNLLEE
jgi:hypothetical protein